MDNKDITTIYWYGNCKNKHFHSKKLHRFIGEKPSWWSFSLPRNFLLVFVHPGSSAPYPECFFPVIPRWCSVISSAARDPKYLQRNSFQDS